jgi:cytochrome P450
MSACNRLDSIVAQILVQRRASQADATSSSSSRSSQDIVGYLLQAQQQQGAEAISDKAIGDEVKTMIFAGSDTSSFTLSVLAHQLALHPDAAERAAAEVLGVLQDTGRAGDVSRLCAADAARLPFITACVNETLRLFPAGPVITRRACEVRQELCGAWWRCWLEHPMRDLDVHWDSSAASCLPVKCTGALIFCLRFISGGSNGCVNIHLSTCT